MIVHTIVLIMLKIKLEHLLKQIKYSIQLIITVGRIVYSYARMY